MAVSFDYTVLSIDFWTKLADKCINIGYDVVFNLDNNKKFKKYKQIFLPMTQQIEFVKLCSSVISFRSGLTDILAGSGIEKIIVIYPPKMNFLTLSRNDMEREVPKAYYWEDNKSFNENIFNITSLNKIFKRDCYKEIIFDGNEEKLLEKLITLIKAGCLL